MRLIIFNCCQGHLGFRNKWCWFGGKHYSLKTPDHLLEDEETGSVGDLMNN